MAKAFADIEAGGEAASLGHAEWLALLLEREASLRRDKRLSKRLQYAKLRQQACIEDIDYRTPRGLDRGLLTMLVEGSWIDDHANLLICGPSGVGKSWLASALGNKACRDNRSVLYQRVPRLFTDLALARGDGRHPRILRALGRVDLLILDDWGLEPLDAAARHDLLEILEDRYGRRSSSSVITTSSACRHVAMLSLLVQIFKRGIHQHPFSSSWLASPMLVSWNRSSSSRIARVRRR
jgi:DNA replication protein DnaC